MKNLLIIIFFSITIQATKYPTHWWKKFDTTTVPKWEILPHEAKAGELILSKRNELGILSNFSKTPFTFQGNHYQSLEGFWQMMKFPENALDPRAKFKNINWRYTRAQVAQMISFQAKKAGDHASQNMKQMGINWVTFNNKKLSYRIQHKGEHYKLIFQATLAKIEQNPKAKEILLSTGNLILRPDHKQNDPPPAWQYYNILMEIRRKLQNQNPRKESLK